MITFPFFCPACNTQTEGKADPAAILFGGRPPLVVTCTNCEAAFKAEVQVTSGNITIGEQVADGNTDD